MTISSYAASSCHVWLNGPEFLMKPEDYWPENVCSLKDLPIEFTLKEKLANVTSVWFSGNTAIDLLLEHFSSNHSFLKATAWLLHFKSYLKDKGKRLTIIFFDYFRIKTCRKMFDYLHTA